jgi:hypothetical protein
MVSNVTPNTQTMANSMEHLHSWRRLRYNIRFCFRVTGRFDELAPCDARSMADKPRYQLRANRLRAERPTLWRLQWWIVGVDSLVGIVAIVLVLTRRWAVGGGLYGSVSPDQQLHPVHSERPASEHVAATQQE